MIKFKNKEKDREPTDQMIKFKNKDLFYDFCLKSKEVKKF